MATTTARTRQTVEGMNAKDRLWDSLSYSYGKKREESDKAYGQQIAAQDRALLSRGMQRSSYGAQSLANMRKEQVKTANDIYDSLIADYENRLHDLEREEKQDEQWERQFEEGQRQFNENLGLQKEQFGYQKDRDVVSDSQWERQFNTQNEQWEKSFGQSVTDSDRQYYATWLQTIAANGGNPSDELLARAGLSRADFDLMKAQVSGGGRGGFTKKTQSDETPPTDSETITNVINALSDTIRSSKDANSNYADLKKYLVQQRKTMDRF